MGIEGDLGRVLIILSLALLTAFYVVLLLRALLRLRLLCLAPKLVAALIVLLLLLKTGVNAFYSVVFWLQLESNHEFGPVFFQQANTSQVIASDWLQIVVVLEFATCYQQKYQTLRSHSGPSRCALAIRLVQLAVSGLAIALLVLYNIKLVGQNALLLSLAGLNLIGLPVVIALRIFLSLKFSGQVIEDQPENQKLRKLSRVIIALLLLRVAEAAELTLLLFDEFKFLDFINYEIGSTSKDPAFLVLLFCAVFVVSQLVTQGMPFNYVCNTDTLEVIGGNNSESLLSDQVSEESDDEPFSPQNFIELATLGNRPRGLGSLVLARRVNQSKQVAIRKVKIELSPYLKEEILAEGREFGSTVRPCLVRVKGIHYEAGLLCIMSHHHELSLESLMNSRVAFAQRVRVGLLLAESVQAMHARSIFHGHICPTNVFVEGTSVRIGDAGMQALKKYAALTQGYSNKDVYTAPQLLKMRGSVVSPTREGDVYSLGMILYELATLNASYRKMSGKQIEKKFGEEGFRPKVPDDVDQRLSSVIRQCWQSDPGSRPAVPILIRQLRVLLN